MSKHQHAGHPARAIVPQSQPPAAVSPPKPVEDEPPITLSEAARRLGRTHTTIARWIEDGLLSYVTMPNGLRAVKPSEVNKFLSGTTILARV